MEQFTTYQLTMIWGATQAATDTALANMREANELGHKDLAQTFKDAASDYQRISDRAVRMQRTPKTVGRTITGAPYVEDGQK